MRALLLLLVPSIALAAPTMGYDDARHLLVRAGYGPTEAEVSTFSQLTRQAAVARLLDGVRPVAVTPPPEWMAEAYDCGGGLKDEPPAVRNAARAVHREHGLELRAWWLRELLATPSPLTEKLVLFWHNHFVSGQPKVRSNQLMYRQNVLLRKNAVGNFRTLLHEVARDPAMLVYLDGAASRREQPNENFAREVMELFTLGEGHYTEADVKEAARAFTGWSVEQATGAFRYRPRFHDDGDKTVLGKTGKLDGDAVLDILLEQPSCAPFLVRKLWRTFVSPDPDEREVARLAKLLRDGGWELKPVLQSLFTSDAFYRPAYRAAIVKSPVELIVGTLRQLDAAPATLDDLALASTTLGQNLFAPPNVKGWPGGDAWIDATTLLGRQRLLARLLREDGVDLHAFGDHDLARRLTRLLLPAPPRHAVDGATNPSAMLQAIVLDPVYELE